MKRLEILKDAQVIQEETMNNALKIIEFLKSEYGVQEEDMEVMITHYAMATERIIKGEIVDEMDEVLFHEIEKNSSYEIAKEIMEKVASSSSCEFPKSEKQFMLLHICNVMRGGEA